MRRNWIKLYVDQCLRGTMMSELSADARWVWIGLLLMAGDSNVEGTIFLRKGEDGKLVGYSDQTLSELLAVDISIFKLAKRKMKRFKKIAVDTQNVIKVLNWKKYQSEYSRQKIYRSIGESNNKNSNSNCNQSNPLELDIDKDKEEEKNNINIAFNFKSEKWENITEKDKERWKKTYPLCDINQELLFMADWLVSNPGHKKSNYKRFISNWLKKNQDRGGTNKAGGQGKLTYLERKEKEKLEIRRKFLAMGDKDE